MLKSILKIEIDDIFEQLSALRKEIFIERLPDSQATVVEYDSSSNNPLPEAVGIDNVKLVVTSPPYGDSRTTVAYGEFSWFSNRIRCHTILKCKTRHCG